MDITAISEQERVGKILKQAFQKDRIPSAYLFVGSGKEVKLKTAIEFVKLINCSEKNSCEKCESCEKINRGIHQDVLIVSPQGSSIKIDQIREVSAFTRYGPSLGKIKAVIVDQADYMTTEAYTSFLKTLEEPAQNILFILLASREDSILSTVASRCQKLVFSDAGNVQDLSDEESKYFFDLLTQLKGFDDGKLVSMWNDHLETEELKVLLSRFMLFLWHRTRLNLAKSKRLISAFKAVSNCYNAIERRANLRLALDVMFFNVKEAIYG